MSPSRSLTVLFLTMLCFAAECKVIFKDALNGDETARKGTNWGILIAGSNTYNNYRHQADVCHAYQVLKAGGLKDENIVVFMYDDIAYNKKNKYPGVIINRPGGENVYHGVPKDYTGEQVSSHNLFAVLQGNKSALTGGSGKVVNSGPNDHIFIYYADHGAPGLIVMPDNGMRDMIYANDLVNALKEKHAARSYKSMVIYVEACESGSMFDGILPDDLNIYAVTAANKSENSFVTYCDDSFTCLGDMFSISWLEDSDKCDRKHETLEHQYETVRQRTMNYGQWREFSHVTQYGDLRLQDDFLSTYQGINHKYTTLRNDSISSSPIALISQYDADLFYFMHKVNITHENSQEKEDARKELNNEISCRNYVDQSVNRIVSFLFNDKHISTVMKTTRPRGKAIVDDWERFKKLIKTYNKYCGFLAGYGLKYARVIANMCNSGIQVNQMIKASKESCYGRPRPPCKTLN